MTTPLHILFAEDSADDAQLIMLQLEGAGLEAEYQRVDNEADFTAALTPTLRLRSTQGGALDLILSDYAMPQFNGLRALSILKASGLDIPFILISGTVGEDIAVEAIKQGADDYIMKDRLARLGSAVQHALEQKRLRAEMTRADETLRESEERYRGIFQTAAVSILEEDFSEVQTALDELRAQGITDFRAYLTEHPDFTERAVQLVKVLDVNDASLKMYGISDKAELLGSLGKLFVEPGNFHEELLAFAEGKTYFEKETLDRRLDGSLIYFWMTITFYTDAVGHRKALVCLIDITARKQAELLQAAIYQISEAANKTESLAEFYRSVHAIIGQVMPAHNLYIALYDAENDLISFPYYVDAADRFASASIAATKPGRGMTEYVIRTGKALLSDAEKFDELTRQGEVELVGSPAPIWIGAPLIVEGRVIGVIAMQDYADAHVYGERELRVLEYVAEQVAKAIERTRLSEAIQRRNHILSALQETTLAMMSELELSETLQIILTHAGWLLDTDNGYIYLVTPGQDEIISVTNIGAFKNYTGAKMKLGEGLAGRVAERGLPLVVNDYQTWQGRSLQYTELKVHALAGVPLISRTKVVGVLGLAYLEPGRTFSQADMDLLSRFAQLASIAFENARLYTLSQQELAERKMTEDALRETEARYRSLVDHLPAITYMAALDKAHLRLYQSPQVEPLLGYSQTEVLTDPNLWKRIIHPDDQARVAAEAERFYATGERFISEYRIFARDGRLLWLHDEAVIIRNEGGQPLFLQGVQFDITARKQAEEKIQWQNLRLKALREIDTAILAADSVENIVGAALEHIRELIKCQRVSMILIDWGANEAVVFAVRSVIETSIQKGTRMPLALFQDMLPTLSKNESVLINDLNTLADPPPQIQSLIKEGLRSLCTLPLFSKGSLIGSISMSSEISGFFDEERINLGREVANQIAIAITQSRLFEETKSQLENLQTLNRVSTALRAAQTKEEMLPILLDETLAILNAQAGAIMLYDEAKDQLKQEAARGWPQGLSHVTMRSGQGLYGSVFASGQAHVSQEIVDDPWLVEEARALIPRGWNQVAVPLRTAREIIGILQVVVKGPRQIQQSEVNLLTTIAEMAGNAIHRSSLRELTEQRLRNLQSLHEMERAISSNFDARFILNMLLDRAITRLEVDAAAVLLFDPVTHMLEYAAGRGFKHQEIEKSRLRLGEGAAGSAAQERRIVVIPDLNDKETDFRRMQLIEDEGFISYYCAPLVAKGKIKGVFETYHRSAYTADSEWIDFLETLAAQAAVAIDNAELFERIQRANLDLAHAYDATIEGWSHALDLRDKETEGHTLRVTELTLQLAKYMGLTDRELVHLRRGALLHDIGKMGIPDNILLKPDKLTDTEWETMKRHPVYAYEMLARIEYLRPALDIPYCHHEKWDGTGYPRGLKEEAIPLEARIFAVVDVYDALTSDRPYRKAWTKEKTFEHILSLSGTHFDPKVVDAFLELRDRDWQ